MEKEILEKFRLIPGYENWSPELQKELLEFEYDDWKISGEEEVDYQTQLEGVPIEEVEKFLRKKKLNRINKS